MLQSGEHRICHTAVWEAQCWLACRDNLVGYVGGKKRQPTGDMLSNALLRAQIPNKDALMLQFLSNNLG